MDKYFTPNIEDIRVGYEVESHEWSCDEAGVPELNYDRWVTKKLDKSYIQTLLEYGIKKENIRVPYLTKEQIETEGWIYNHFWFEKGSVKINIVGDSWMRIFKKDVVINGSEVAWITLFNGYCKDINTFRYITKLLGI